MIPVIYALCEPNTNTIRYIGQTIHLKKRIRQHYTNLSKHTYKNHWLQSLLTNGQKATVIVLNEFRTIEYLDQAEMMWISYCREHNFNLTNGNNGGNGNKGHITSDETKEKISAAMKGNKHGLGYKHTDLARQQMSDSRKGHKPCNTKPNAGSFKKGIVPINKKTTLQQDIEIQIKYTAGQSIRSLAKEYGIDRSGIRKRIKTITKE